MDRKKLTLFQGGIIFSVTEILFLVAYFFGIFDNYYINGIMVEVGIILLPAIIFILIFKKDIKVNLKLKKINWIHSLIIVVTMWFMIPVSLSLSFISAIIVRFIFQKNILPDIPVPGDVPSLLLSIIVIGLFAAICEEILFRGALWSSVEKIGLRKSMILISLVFTLFHFNFEKIAGVFVLSIVICYIVYRTNSIFAGILAHFTNNATAVLFSYGVLKSLPEGMETSSDFSTIFNQDLSFIIGTLIIFGIIAIISGSVVFGLLYLLKSQTTKTVMIIKQSSFISLRNSSTFIPGFMIMAGMYIYLLSKYLAG
ncbi:MAG: CPBP family intramembrane metalloprotease [Clostridiales bacterium]|nr:CPBP family intramembrane metalloprotease [Clostridiales bacterium]